MIGIDSMPQIGSLFVFAQIVGLVAVFAPAGLGVREGVLIMGLAPLVGPGSAIVISGACRVWQTLIELVMTGLAWIGLRYATCSQVCTRDAEAS